ncbi:MAG: helix-turn-helix domain-containing protein [Eubacteriales bacterium]|nr:helix-turn-helix domain-containing protein [Eubacteriales bacterium]
MTEQRFLISEAARMVAVEAHVLRYWEEELEIPVGRTELGHRYYTRENIEMFQNVKELKEKGLQLRAIRQLLKEKEHVWGAAQNGKDTSFEKGKEGEEIQSPALIEQNTKKLRQFEELVSEIVDKVIKENNEQLQGRIEDAFSREMEYLLHMQEKREEERFRKLDEAIRAHQKSGRTAAAAKEHSWLRRWFAKQ